MPAGKHGQTRKRHALLTRLAADDGLISAITWSTRSGVQAENPMAGTGFLDRLCCSPSRAGTTCCSVPTPGPELNQPDVQLCYTPADWRVAGNGHCLWLRRLPAWLHINAYWSFDPGSRSVLLQG